MSTEREALHAQIMNVPPTKGIFDTLTTEAERGAYMVGHRDARHAAAELVAAATSAHSASESGAMEELRRVLAGVGVVGQIDGHDVIRRLSVLDLVDRRIAAKEQQ
jgi:hypothetical protein